MSGIFGIVNLNALPVEGADLDRMGSALAHRGPHGGEVWKQGSVGLGHRLLYTTPESLREVQPVRDPSAGLTLTADARLDNRGELIRLLEVPPSHAHRITDSELILAAYRRWGTDAPEHLLGDFAFALWDEQQQALFCARDHFGIKPFYYVHLPGQRFAFASEIKALLPLEGVSAELDEVEVARHLLVPVRNDATTTLYRHIRKIAPAHHMLVRRTGLAPHRYWALDPTRSLHMDSDEAYVEAFREHFTEAVRVRLRSAFPVGSMLSGGHDSSSITCVAAQLKDQIPGGQLHTFSAVFDKVPASDERSYIASVCEKYEVVPHFFHADEVSPLYRWRRHFWHTDVASSGGNLYINWRLYETAQQEGVRVVLDGFDGDTAVSHGTGYFYELAAAHRWLRLIAEVKAFSEKQGERWEHAVWAWIQGYGLRPLRTRLGRALRGAPPPEPLDAPSRRAAARERWGAPLHPAFADAVLPYTEPHSPPEETERAHHHRLLSRGLLSYTLELLDTTAAAHAVELRFPFFDKRLVEFCLALPPEQKLRRGWSRLVLRRAMEGILPAEVQWRPRKSDLSPSFDYGLLTFERRRIEEMIAHDTGGIGRFVSRSFLKEAYTRYAAREAAAQDKVLLWRALSLALWLEHTRPSWQQEATVTTAAESLQRHSAALPQTNLMEEKP